MSFNQIKNIVMWSVSKKTLLSHNFIFFPIKLLWQFFLFCFYLRCFLWDGIFGYCRKLLPQVLIYRLTCPPLPSNPSVDGFWKLLKSGNAGSWVKSSDLSQIGLPWVGLVLLLLAVLHSPLVVPPPATSCTVGDVTGIAGGAGTLCERDFFPLGFCSDFGDLRE